MSAADDEAITDLGEEEEDLPPRVRRPKRNKLDRAASAAESEPSPADHDEAAAATPVPLAPAKASPYAPWEKALVVLAVIIGIIFGVWFAGRPATPATAPTAGASTAAGGQVSEDPAVRMAELQAVLAANPDDVLALVELGVLYFDDRQYDQAGAMWQRATELDPLQVQAWYNLGFYHLSTTPPDYEAAKAAWDKVLTIAPDSEMADTIQSHLAGLIPDEDEAGGD